MTLLVVFCSRSKMQAKKKTRKRKKCFKKLSVLPPLWAAIGILSSASKRKKWFELFKFIEIYFFFEKGKIVRKIIRRKKLDFFPIALLFVFVLVLHLSSAFVLLIFFSFRFSLSLPSCLKFFGVKRNKIKFPNKIMTKSKFLIWCNFLFHWESQKSWMIHLQLSSLGGCVFFEEKCGRLIWIE